MNTIKLNTIGTSCKAGGNAGGGNGGGSASSVEYLDVRSSKDTSETMQLMFLSSSVRMDGDGYLNIYPTAVLITESDSFNPLDLVAIEINMDGIYLMTNAEPKTIKAVLEERLGKEFLAALPRITKEEFYNIA